ncbi:hypothetical protein BU23DRAFT_512189 [Bimuria novae-zelandiae CBS 107.79]|uniref:Uncharacterized protein n=1 Tax=Bimuria novae-zelandiae CBS 107.79 TaxID=1447943 RepID=A0A6A5V9M0_9PLEO|nr:hypothetical protein BU23DRAFT_512189 [Bimuria novae-zelandiae CBS 107.79]
MTEVSGFTRVNESDRRGPAMAALPKVQTNTSGIDRRQSASSPRHRRVNAAEVWPSGPPDYVSKEPSQHSYEEIWQEIEKNRGRGSDDFIRVYCTFARPPTLEKVMTWQSAWSSWNYQVAYPHFSMFLKSAGLKSAGLKNAGLKMLTRCTLFLEDCEISEANSRKIVKTKERYLFRDFQYNDLWDTIKKRPMWDSASLHANGVQEIATSTFRLIQITDLSPMVLTCILGCTPSLDVGIISSFMDRHLDLKNWGKVNFPKLRNMGWSSFTIEYHFSFYYVSTEYSDPEYVRKDSRSWRRSAPFGRDKNGTVRHIHEETISFLLVNHRGIGTCLQLEEAYWKDPYAKDLGGRTFRPFDVEVPPALLFLSWIAVALHHVSWRWESAIAAVDAEIMTPAQVVFTPDRDILMTDDPQFSHAKTYYWALQSYKLFEQKIKTTVETWRCFEEESLKKLWHSKVDAEEWHMKQRSINLGIDQLEKKMEKIRQRIEEVKDLREGLASASALFNSRTAVRQGDNIRLLTYVNLLFLPLTFGTSIFGMQIMGSNTRVLHAFAIALPSATLLTLFIIINLENVLDIFASVKQRTADKLRHHMRHHRRKHWKQRAINITEAEVARHAVPRMRRSPGGWTYFMFLLESMCVGIPGHEVLAARRWFIAFLEKIRFRKTALEISIEKGKEKYSTESGKGTPTHIKKLLVRNRAQREREMVDRKERQRRKKWSKRLLNMTIAPLKLSVLVFRVILLPFWAGLLLVEYLVLILYFTAIPPSEYELLHSNSDRNKASNNLRLSSPWIRAIHTMGIEELLASRFPEEPLNVTADNDEALRPAKLFRKATTIAQKEAALGGTSGGFESILKQRERHTEAPGKVKASIKSSTGSVDGDVSSV